MYFWQLSGAFTTGLSSQGFTRTQNLPVAELQGLQESRDHTGLALLLRLGTSGTPKAPRPAGGKRKNPEHLPQPRRQMSFCCITPVFGQMWVVNQNSLIYSEESLNLQR